ncbi:Serpentine Receptor, class Z [Caenorhabditis elegans]|uniref:Serpentine Receptor, class Z n=1 Tax=Caenorhabditis elegans TaxID=6239 RepID=E9P850_CAEEL|nr:Serpentine Receptor, class Z [Caenorhabditis elegans]CCD71402.2 Serpentine Receptor, class Z [Caenorhabditis elegans]|eukprot:NP_001317753.1 Uncharacterized protein CELE_F47D2.11 [Caenorhabditis elegans]
MVKLRVTTEAPVEELLDLLLDLKNNLIVLAASGLLVAVLFLCMVVAYPFYLRSFKNNLVFYGKSTLLPIITFEYRTIKYNYFVFFVLVGLLFTTRSYPSFAFYIMTISNIYALVNHLSTSIYEIAISIVTIHRFINFRQKMELRRDLTLKNVTILLFLIILSVLVRESSFVVWMAFALLESHHMLLEQTLNYYYVTFFVFQLLLFTALIVQFTMTSDGQNTHADIQIVRQVKIIGFIKLIILIVFVISTLTSFASTMIGSIFVSIDFFLVPVVVMWTEIKANPGVIQIFAINNKLSNV